MLTRRYFIRASAVAMAGSGIAPSWLARAAAPAEGKRKILIAIFQRGAADGLNIVVPYFEKRYYEIRPSIAVPAPATQTVTASPSQLGTFNTSLAANAVLSRLSNTAIDLDGRFGLHP